MITKLFKKNKKETESKSDSLTPTTNQKEEKMSKKIEKIKTEDLATTNKPTWCPGCGDYGIMFALKSALTKLDIEQKDVVIVEGIGCHGHICNFINTYHFEGLHGRPIPVAEGIKIANDKLKVIIIAGDGDTFGEGMNHFISGLRGNHDVTLLVFNNMIYGLTTGQTSPTSAKGTKTKSTPTGVIEVPVNPMTLGITAGGSFVARGYAGEIKQLTELITKAVEHKGFSVVDILQQCVSFNKVNDIKWYNERVYKIEEQGHDPTNKMKALEKAFEFGEKIPTGIFYQDNRESYQDNLPEIKEKPLAEQEAKNIDMTKSFEDYT